MPKESPKNTLKIEVANSENIKVFWELFEFYTKGMLIPGVFGEDPNLDPDYYRGDIPQLPERKDGKNWSLGYLTRGVQHTAVLSKFLRTSPNVSLCFLGKEILSKPTGPELILNKSKMKEILASMTGIDIIIVDPDSRIYEEIVDQGNLLEWGGIICRVTSGALSEVRPEYKGQVFDILHDKNPKKVGFDLDQNEVSRLLVELKRRTEI